MNNFDLNSSRWRRMQEIDRQIAELQKEREQISQNLGATDIPYPRIVKPPIEVKLPRDSIAEPLIGVKPTWNDGLGGQKPLVVPPLVPGKDRDNPWGWIIAIVVIIFILAGLGTNEQPNTQPNPTQSAPAQTN